MRHLLSVAAKLFIFPWMFFCLVFAQTLPTQTSNIFSGSGNCATCHEPGLPNSSALLGPNGEDISPVTLWRSTMMANAAKDPFWQAKITAEVAAHPQFQTIIEDKCLTCHSPLGRTEALYNGAPYYTLQEMQADTLALDGVSCTSCHQIQDVNLGDPSSFSGHYVIENIRLIYGPYTQPFEPPMITWVHYVPTYGPHMLTSEMCATCHTLFTPTVDNNGQIVGEAPEQTPYLEWLNSDYAVQDITCQSCHVPEINYPVVISNMPVWLQARSPFYKHYFVGGNTFMLKILRDHGAEIGVTATTERFDSTIARTYRQLQRETAELNASYSWISSDTLQVKVAVKNKTGHKFPTAYPSRRAWIYLNLTQSGGQSVFTSGHWDPQSGEINQLDMPYETHYNLITDGGQVQVYEALIKDVDDQITYTLLRAAGFKKDNRIPPAGFTTSGPAYDSTRIEGLAAQDANFNISHGIEGSGCDTVTYKIGGLSMGQEYQLTVKLLYQSLMPRYAADLFQYSTPEVTRFQNFYQQADKSPVTIDSLGMDIAATSVATSEGIAPESPLLINAYPNPFNPEVTIEVETGKPGLITLSVYNFLGEKVRTFDSFNAPQARFRLKWDARTDAGQSVASGEYILEVRFRPATSSRQIREYRKILYLK